MPLFAYVNNLLWPEEEATLPVQDLAVQRGYGVFDFFRLENGKPLFLQQHLERFFSSARYMRLEPGCTIDDLKTRIKNLVEKNKLSQAGVRITLTGGASADSMSIGKPNLVITQQPINSTVTAQVDQGIQLATYHHQRQLPHVKTIDYLMAVWLQPYIKEKGADDVLYCFNGLVTECPRSNFFMITTDNKLVTPGTDVLYGITRNVVLQLAKNAGYGTEERTIRVEELATAGAAFVTSTTKKILPVHRINNTVFPSAEQPLIRHLIKLFDQHIAASLNRDDE